MNGGSRACRILEQPLALEQQHAVSRKVLQPAPQLVDVPPPQQIRVAVVIVAVVRGVRAEALLLAREARRLLLHGLRERQRLAAAAHLVLIAGERPIDRISQEHDDPGVGQEPRRALRNQRMRQVIR